MHWLIRILAYLWASPATVIGLPIALATLLTGGSVSLVNGVIEVHGRITYLVLSRVVSIFLPGGASAMTLGHIVIATSQAALDITRTHERVHVRQYERWGPFFLPAYLGASLLIYLRHGDPYRDNPFEKEAYHSD